ncbi:MAG: hypothetical protein H6581_13615 [Bacteroidia bacterium]|nr:hypothetical protein [Bacteroidia bacterium]
MKPIKPINLPGIMVLFAVFCIFWGCNPNDNPNFGEETWIRFYGAGGGFDNAVDMINDPDGNGYYLMGGQLGNFSADRLGLRIYRVDGVGTQVGEPFEEPRWFGSAMFWTQDGNIAVGGDTTTASGKRAAFLMVISPALDTIFTSFVSEQDSSWRINDVIEAQDGGFLLLGSLEFDGIVDPYLIKFDDQGNLLWRKKHSSLFPIEDGVKILANGSGYLLLIAKGNFENEEFVFSEGYALLQVNEAGEKMMATSSPAFSNRVVGFAQTGLGYRVCGNLYPDQAKPDSSLVLIDEWDGALNFLGSDTVITGAGYQTGHTSQASYSGGYLIGGTRIFKRDSTAALLINLNGQDKVIISETYGTGDQLEVNSVLESPQGNFILWCSFLDGTTRMPFLVKTNSQGKVVD